jgi:predicted glycogen debranching enzyme
MIELDREICSEFQAAASREWLETNGLGGFASGTVAGLNTRRYHGLLTAALTPPVGRTVLLSKLEEVVIIDGEQFKLSCNSYPGAIHPDGYKYLIRFRLDPFPIFTYQIGQILIERSIFMIKGENSTVVSYRAFSPIDKPGKLSLEVRPLIAFRDFHATTRENNVLNRLVNVEPGIVGVTPYEGLPTLYMAHNAGRIDQQGYWYRNFEYSVERERGLDFTEDLFSPCSLTFELTGDQSASLIASTERRDIRQVPAYFEGEIARREEIVAAVSCDDQLVQQLVVAADQFIVARGDQKTVIAGYHWFSDWGRDTMIALPGLTLVNGRADVARSILLEFARHVDRGMLPNRFPDGNEEPEYNTVDATLWFFDAVRALIASTNDYDFVRHNLYEVLKDVIEWHLRGTRYGIRIDSDGLLISGQPGVQLTWMDAKVGDWVVTPRSGKPVEIQALWYNAVGITEELACRFGDDHNRRRYQDLAERARTSFNALFWNEETDCLYDCIEGEIRDTAIRPNQIFAVSLTNSMLSGDRAPRVVEVVQRHLLTPFGLRSLSPDDPNYAPRYEGGVLSRDGAYHQGTVWPWLMGPFITAYVKINRGTKKSRQDAARLLEGFRDHMLEAGLGQISEIFDGEGPHLPRGCVAQAWSVSELLRAAVEDIYTSNDVTQTPCR